MNIKKFLLGSAVVVFLLIILGFGVFNISSREVSPGSAPSQGRSFTTAPEVPLPSQDVKSPEKRLIKMGNLQLVVQDASWSVGTIRDIAQKNKGFVESSRISENSQGGKEGVVTIRVPVDAFSSVVESIKAVAQRVESESTTAQDITQQYVDLQARLKNLQSTEAQYLEILKKAQSVEEILKVQERLSQVRGDIESMQAQIKYFANQSDLATITINLSEEPTISLSFKDFRPLTIIKTSLQALVRGLIVIFNLLVSAVIVLLPLALVGLLIIWILWKIAMMIKNRYLN